MIASTYSKDSQPIKHQANRESLGRRAGPEEDGKTRQVYHENGIADGYIMASCSTTDAAGDECASISLTAFSCKVSG